MRAVARVEQLPMPARSIRIKSRRFLPEKCEWVASVEKAVAAIGRKELEKVVLARCCVLECEKPPDPFAIVSALKPRARNATLFCFASENFSFLGATPELLFTREKNRLVSEAVAGTRMRGKSLSEDESLEEDLLGSAKDLREFSPVRSFLQEALSPLCASPISFSPLHVRKTQNVQHLCSRLTGLLKDGVSDAEILRRIHPTPALCGTPTLEAFQWIQKLEPFQRGLYGGAIGWTSKEASEWAVAIRCCLIEGTTIRLYTGTGIVEGSNPEEEWEELDLKMKLYEGIFS
jgi:menaquinone-specific isochorismate synthase